MRFLVLVLACGTLAAQTLAAQSALQFEVASIKPSGPRSERGWEGGPGSKDPIRYVFGQATLKDLIVTAWNVDYDGVFSTESLDKAEFDLSVKIAPGTSKDEFRMMMQNLLRERFQLVSHSETREFPGYALTRGPTRGPQLAEWVEGAAGPVSREGWPELPANRPALITQNRVSGRYVLGRMRGTRQSMAKLAEALRIAVQAHVVDRTGMPGLYDFSLEFASDLPGAPPDVGAEPPTAPSPFTAVQQQLGLKLTAAKIPLPVVVVESFRKMPTEN